MVITPNPKHLKLKIFINHTTYIVNHNNFIMSSVVDKLWQYKLWVDKGWILNIIQIDVGCPTQWKRGTFFRNKTY